MFSTPRTRFAIAAAAVAAAIALALPAFASAAEFPLTITAEGSGSGTWECEVEATLEPCAAEYAEGTEVTVVPEAEPGSEFVEFFGDCGPLACELTMNEAHSVKVVFDLEPGGTFPLTVETFGTGTGTVECEVEAGPAEPCEAEYAEGTELSLVATADPGSEFVEWLEDCSGAGPCELTMNEAHSVTALFELEPEEFALNIEEPGTGSGTVQCEAQEGPQPCAAEYPEGTELIVLATADPGSEFVEWSGECVIVTGNECELTMDEEHSVTATFDLEPGSEPTLSITKAGSGTGTVKCEINGGPLEACAASYPNATSVKLTASADAGSTFAGYSAGSGSASGCSSTPCTFTIEANSAVTATFNLIARTLTITKAGTGTGTVKCEINGGPLEACAASYPNATSVKLTASADAGSTFTGFSAGSGSASGCSSSPCTFTIEANSAVTATFNLIARTLSITKAGTGTGTVKCEINGGPLEACAASYPNATSVKLTASADPGSTFTVFSAGSGSASGCSSSPCTFTIEANSAVTATFNAKPAPPPAETCATNPSLCPPVETCATNPALCPPPIAGTAKAAPSALVKAGKAQLKLSCSGGACKGSLKLTAKIDGKNKAIGKASFSLASGATATLKVKLSAPALKALKSGKALKAKLSGTGIAASAVKLKAAKG